jgi:hypothetical protein
MGKEVECLNNASIITEETAAELSETQECADVF